MAKFRGIVGYISFTETSPGVYDETVTEVSCSGDILRNSQSWEGTNNLNDDLTINNRFSIVATEVLLENAQYLRYISWRGAKWKIKNFEIARPRLILSVGGLYNG